MWTANPRHACGYESIAKAFSRLWIGQIRMFVLFLPAPASHHFGGTPMRPPTDLWKFKALVRWGWRYPNRVQDTFGWACHAISGAKLPKFRALRAASDVRSIGGIVPLYLRLHVRGIYKACSENERKQLPQCRAPSLRLLPVPMPGPLQFVARATRGAMERTPKVCSAVSSAGILMHQSILGHGLPIGCGRDLD